MMISQQELHNWLIDHLPFRAPNDERFARLSARHPTSRRKLF